MCFLHRLDNDAESQTTDIAQPLFVQALIADELGIPEYEREQMLPNGKQRLLHNRIHWAKFYLSKAGLVDSPRRGVFITNAAGKELLSSKPSFVGLDTLKRYPSFVEFYGSAASLTANQQSNQNFPVATLEITPEEQIDAAYSTIVAALRADLLSRILDQSPSFFERLIVDLLVGMGYGGSHEDAALRLGKSGDVMRPPK